MTNTGKKSVRTRMAPSPTGELHIGSLAILLKNYALAKQNQGAFILRIEDTDRTRYVEGTEERMMLTIRAYGLDWDEGPDKDGDYGPYRQSDRLELYQKYVSQLLDQQKAYHCFCSPERLKQVREEQQAQKQPPRYDRHCRHLEQDEVEKRLAAGEQSVIRLAVPDKQQVSFIDLLRGEISFNTSEVDDQVLIKSDGFPTYHLAVVVDDHLMEISHVLRGEEWISSTPKHVLLYQAFGWDLPTYAHIPLYLNPDGKGKMSKRKGTVSAQHFLDQGILPEAMLNFLMILGWSPKDGREILSLDEYVQEFDLERISHKSVVFDLQKLEWINGQYIRALSDEDLHQKLASFLPTDFPREKAGEILPLIKERLVRLSDIEELTAFFYRDIKPEEQLLLKKASQELVIEQLERTKEKLGLLSDFSIEAIEKSIRLLQSKYDWKKGQYFMMLRIAATGKKATPPLFETMAVIGQKTINQRLEAAQDIIKQKD